MQDRVARMVVEAESRMHDAGIIGQSLDHASNSQALLEILALEVLLKALQLHTTGRILKSHNYLEIWKAIPVDTRRAVVVSAKDQFPAKADLSNVEKLLCIYEHIFTKARYAYEIYDDLSFAEQEKLGSEWVARGAPTEEADVQYFPLELTALLRGLLEVAHRAA